MDSEAKTSHFLHSLQNLREELETFLLTSLPPAFSHGGPLREAMEYSLLGGGKRIRALLAILSCRAIAGKDPDVLPFAAALEMIHSYSLVHDDLPCLDNDDFRRGKPSTHKQYGEAVGVLVGDALLTQAFFIIAEKTPDAQVVRALTRTLAYYAGAEGMVVGQMADILGEQTHPTPELVDFIHKKKTGALITAACRGGAIAAKGTSEQVQALTSFGEKLGLAFQIVDDLLDVEGNEQQVGKAVGKDAAKGKITYPALWGIEKSRQRAEELMKEAQECIGELPQQQQLLSLAHYIVYRDQ